MRQGYVPSSGLLAEHYAYGRWATDAPPIFHIASMLTCIATLCAHSARVRFRGDERTLNLWALIVGRSSIDRKTTATKLATRIARKVAPERIVSPYGSPEGILQHLQENPCAMIYASEGGSLFSQRQAKYWQHMREAIMDLYDADDLFRRQLAGDKSMEIINPRLSLLGAVAEGLLERYTTDTDWIGGFMPRFLCVAGEKVIGDRDFRRDLSQEERLEALLRNVHVQPWQTIRLEDQPAEIIADLRRELEGSIESYPETIQPCIARLPATAVKLAGLYEIGRHAADPPPGEQAIWIVEESAQCAADLCRASRDAALKHFGHFGARDKFDRLCHLALRRLEEAGPEGVSKAGLLRALRVPADERDRILAFLEELGVLDCRWPSSGGRGRKAVHFVLKDRKQARRLVAAGRPPGWAGFDNQHNLDGVTDSDPGPKNQDT